MTTKSRILSLALSLLMVVALFAPMSLVFAEGGLQIVRASDNGGTTATSTAREAIAGLGSGTSWYSANRNNLTGKISKAVYTLKQSAFVDGVEIAFYYADQRSFQFSIEYSMDKEIWETAFEKTWSTQQEADKTAEYFEFPEQVEALYLQVTIYDAKVVATGAQNNYGAFYSFEAFGEFDPEGIIDPDTVAPEGQVWANKATQTEGSLHTNAIYHPAAACPNLRTKEGVWFSANASGDARVAAVYRFNLEVDLYEIQLDWYKGGEGRVYEYAIYFSTNNRDWVEVMESGSLSNGATDVIECEGSAVYVKIVSEDGWLTGGGTANNWIALEEIRFYGDYVEDGKKPVAEIAAAQNWINIQKDLHEELYTPESWAKFDAAIQALDLNTPFDQQAALDAAVAAAKEAQLALEFVDIEGLQIAQSYWSDGDYATGSTAWTYGSVIFTEPGYTLDQYKVQNMTLANWVRVFAVPTEEAGVYEISNIIPFGTAVTADEEVPENEYGIGFAIAFYTYNDGDGLDAGTESQYAAVEFGMRNQAAWDAMELVPGDKVQLNNIIFTEEQFAEEGEEMQAAWLETEGSWKHRYYDKENLGSFIKTPIYRQSKVANPDAVEGGPQYLAQDEFIDFVTYSTMTKIVEDVEEVLCGDVNDDTVVDAFDISALAQYVAGWNVTINEAAADVNADTVVDAFDISTLAQYVAGWNVTLG